MFYDITDALEEQGMEQIVKVRFFHYTSHKKQKYQSIFPGN